MTFIKHFRRFPIIIGPIHSFLLLVETRGDPEAYSITCCEANPHRNIIEKDKLLNNNLFKAYDKLCLSTFERVMLYAFLLIFGTEVFSSQTVDLIS